MLPMLMLMFAVLGVCGILIGIFSTSSIMGLQPWHIPIPQQQIEISKQYFFKGRGDATFLSRASHFPNATVEETFFE